jgi:Prenyltransferase and squalene oxidase repeat
MRHHRHFRALVVPLACLAAWGVYTVGLARVDDDPGRKEKAPDARAETRADPGAKTWTTAVEPKPLSRNVKKGLDWLVEHQLPVGGWGEGEESAQMRGGGQRDSFRDKPNVADTCIAVLALIRSGSTPREGPYRGAIEKGVRYVRSQVEESDSQSLAVTSVRGTRVQMKLGPNIDTFLASMLLAEVKGRMPDEAGEKAVDLALHKVIGKIERHQKQDGAFDGEGWAPILAQAMCGKGINRARQAGARVSDKALGQATGGARLAYEASSRPMPAGVGASGLSGAPTLLAGTASPSSAMAGGRGMGMMGGMGGSAGVELYARSASVGVLQDSVNTYNAEIPKLRDQAAHAPDPKERARAEERLSLITKTKEVQQQAQAAAVARLDDPRFIAGFGSNGGEEFLSYMNLAESLVVKGGDEWKRWDSQMTDNLNRVQNDDGSWSGQHCITGRTFCTSTALLVLMADRTPVPVQAKDKAPAPAVK